MREREEEREEEMKPQRKRESFQHLARKIQSKQHTKQDGKIHKNHWRRWEETLSRKKRWRNVEVLTGSPSQQAKRNTPFLWSSFSNWVFHFLSNTTPIFCVWYKSNKVSFTEIVGKKERKKSSQIHHPNTTTPNFAVRSGNYPISTPFKLSCNLQSSVYVCISVQ